MVVWELSPNVRRIHHLPASNTRTYAKRAPRESWQEKCCAYVSADVSHTCTCTHSHALTPPAVIKDFRCVGADSQNDGLANNLLLSYYPDIHSSGLCGIFTEWVTLHLSPLNSDPIVHGPEYTRERQNLVTSWPCFWWQKYIHIHTHTHTHASSDFISSALEAAFYIHFLSGFIFQTLITSVLFAVRRPERLFVILLIPLYLIE